MARQKLNFYISGNNQKMYKVNTETPIVKLQIMVPFLHYQDYSYAYNKSIINMYINITEYSSSIKAKTFRCCQFSQKGLIYILIQVQTNLVIQIINIENYCIFELNLASKLSQTKPFNRLRINILPIISSNTQRIYCMLK